MPLAFTTGTSSHPKNTLQKRKFEIKVLLLLHILIPGVMLSSLETINPWLSACDLKQEGSSDFKGSCSAATGFPARTTTPPPPDVELLCPKECPPNESKTNASCLAYLDEARRSAICNFDLGNGIEWLKSFLGTIRLRHCCEYKIIESLSNSLLQSVLKGKDECFRIIDSLVEVDNLAARVTCEFSEILSRYDCGQPYSVKFSCNDCLEAYRRWVCSTLVPYFNDSVRIRPCRSVCQAVEQKCPYFLPENKAPALPTQYAGEPTFLCMDPNIPETGEQQKKSLYPDQNTCCVKICGSLKDGLCTDKGTKCENEQLMSYEEAVDQKLDCGGSESSGSRVPSLECTASEPYSSPHKLGSGAPRTHPGPPLILYSCLILTPSHRIHYLILFLLLNYYLFPFPFVKLLGCLTAVLTEDFSRINLLLIRFKTETKLFFHSVKRSNLIFNYFKFNSNKWQYYFILISVNLFFNLFIKNPEPLTTPPCLINGFEIGKSEKPRRARRYYYYFYYNNYYYYYYKHYYTILSSIAQISNERVPDSRDSRDSTGKTLNLVITTTITTNINNNNDDDDNNNNKTIRDDDKKNLISIKNENSLTIINRIKIDSDILNIIILIKDFRMGRGRGVIAEASANRDRFVVCSRWRTKTNDDFEASAIVAALAEASVVLRHVKISSRLTLYYDDDRDDRVRDRGSRKYSFRKYHEQLVLVGSEINVGGSESKPVKLCWLTRLTFSDPKCEFQTFSYIKES